MATHAFHGQSRINPFSLAAIRAAQPRRINNPLQGLAQLAQVIAFQRLGRKERERLDAGRKAENSALAAILAGGPGRGTGARAVSGGQAELAELLSGVTDPAARRSLASIMVSQRSAQATRAEKRLDRLASAEQKRLDRENRLEIANIRSGATPAQQSNNLEIASARQSVARTIEQFAKANELGTDEAVGSALTRLYATADELGIMGNPDHNPTFRLLVTRAMQRKVGEDQGFERFQSFVTGSIPAVGQFPTFGQPGGAVAGGPGARGAMPLPELTAELNQGFGAVAQAPTGPPPVPIPAPRQAALPSQQPLAGAGRAAAAVPVSALRGPIAARAPTNVLPPGQQPLPLPGSGAFGAPGPLGTPAPAVPPVTRTTALQPSSTAALRDQRDQAAIPPGVSSTSRIPQRGAGSVTDQDLQVALQLMERAQATGNPAAVAQMRREISRRIIAAGDIDALRRWEGLLRQSRSGLNR